MGGGLLQALLQRSMANRQAEQDAPMRQQQLENMRLQQQKFELELAEKKAEVDRMRAQQKFIQSTIEKFTPTEPETAGWVKPGTPADAAQPGFRPVPGGIPQIPQESLLQIMSTLATMKGDPESIGKALGNQQQAEKAKGIKGLFSGGGAPITGESVAAGLIKSGAAGNPEALAKIAQVKEATGIDLLGYAKQATAEYLPRSLYDKETGEEYTARWDKRMGQFELTPTGEIKKFGVEKPTQYKEIDIAYGGGEKRRFWYREDEPPIGGTLLGPTRSNQLVPPSELEKFVGPEGNPAPFGLTYGGLERGKFTPIPSTRQSTLSSQAGVVGILDQIKDLGNKLFSGITPTNRLFKTVKVPYEVWTQSNPDAAMYESFINGTVAPMIRSLGEKGTLATEDVKRAINLLPSYYPMPDTEAVYKLKISGLETIFRKVRESNLPATPKDRKKEEKQKSKFTIIEVK